MLMAKVPDDQARPILRQRPGDFSDVFVLIGRLACEEHYHAGRPTVDRWLDEAGKDDLIARRAAFVREVVWKELRRPCPADFDSAFVALGVKGCARRYQTSPNRIYRWLEERGKDRLISLRENETRVRGLDRIQMGRMLSKAFPVERT